MSNCINDKQKGLRTERMIMDEMERMKKEHKCDLINAETKAELVEKYKKDGCAFENAFKKIANNMKEFEQLPEGVVTDNGAFEEFLHRDIVEAEENESKFIPSIQNIEPVILPRSIPHTGPFKRVENYELGEALQRRSDALYVKHKAEQSTEEGN